MPWSETIQAVRMSRLAIAGPRRALRDLLVELADAGVVDLEAAGPLHRGAAAEALGRIHGRGADEPGPRLARHARPVAELEAAGRADLLAGESELERHAESALTTDSFVALAGWCPSAELDGLRNRLQPMGGGVVELEPPPYAEPPTLHRTPGAATAFNPLVQGYGSVRYADVDPTPFAAITFVLMFGMMFADAGHGLLLVALGLYLGFGRNRRLARLQRVWPIPVAAGLVAALFGVAYGEAFGPTGLVPVVWLRPLENPLLLLAYGVLAGAVLLAVSYAIGSVNRWREGGPSEALFAQNGLAGGLLFAGGGALVAAFLTRSVVVAAFAAAAALLGVGLVFVGLRARAGGGALGVMEAGVETFNAVIRLFANAISFARLAAFGMVHAAIGALVWAGALALWRAGMPYLAVPVFVLGTAVAFGLEALVAGVQALRLEYYELFSRVYSGEGRAFAPWHVTVVEEV